MLTKRQFSALALVTLFGSFFGGAVMEWVLTGKGARAEGAEKVIRADRFEAREFRVVDEEGRTRVSIDVFEDDPHVDLLDENGNPRAAICIVKGEPGLLMLDENRKMRASMTVHKDKRCSVQMRLGDENGDSRVSMGIWRGQPVISVLDANGVMRASMMEVEGRPCVTVCDENSGPRAVLGCSDPEDGRTESVEKRQESSLVLFKSDGDVLWEAP